MDKFDEQALRRDTFTEGREVVLADGQSWSLARPYVIFRIDSTASGFIETLRLDGDDGAFSALMKRYDAAETNFEYMTAIALIGHLLLTRNYDLTPDQVGDLMPFGFDEDTEPGRIQQEVMRVARGRGPKPEGDGTGSSPTQPE